MEDVITTHLALGAIISYALQWLKNAKWFPWLAEHTTTLNRLLSAVAAFLSSVGIVAASTGHLSWETGTTITLAIPSLSIIWQTGLNTLGQWVIQEGVYKGLVQPATVKAVAAVEPAAVTIKPDALKPAVEPANIIKP